jgi:glycolate dehydrogenase FAD-binding subunit
MEELAAALRDAERAVIRGGGTKGGPTHDGVEISTAGLDRVVEHNAGDMTAVVEAGVRLAHLREVLATEGQMLALDPPDPGGATLGGAVATADSGPLRTRYGGARDLVLGVTVVLGDGTVAKAGGKVIKNVAGYDLAKLFTGSRGTLGAIVRLALRLHPIPPHTATAVLESADPDALAAAASTLSHAALEQQSLDVRWQGESGMVLCRFGGASPRPQAEAAAALIDGEVVDDDGALWDAQREAQLGRRRIATVQTELPRILRAARERGGTVVGRAGLALLWVDPELAPEPEIEPGARKLMDRVKERFDPDGVLPAL